MVFTIGERIYMLTNLPPAEGRLTGIRAMRKFKEELSISEEEVKEVAYKEVSGKAYWNPLLDKGKDIEVSDFVKGLLLEAFTKMEQANPPRLKEEFVGLYDKLGYVSIDN
jgi:hypothetical protein